MTLLYVRRSRYTTYASEYCAYGGMEHPGKVYYPWGSCPTMLCPVMQILRAYSYAGTSQHREFFFRTKLSEEPERERIIGVRLCTST